MSRKLGRPRDGGGPAGAHAWREALAQIGAHARFTRRYRAQTNSEVVEDEAGFAEPPQVLDHRRYGAPRPELIER